MKGPTFDLRRAASLELRLSRDDRSLRSSPPFDAAQPALPARHRDQAAHRAGDALRLPRRRLFRQFSQLPVAAAAARSSRHRDERACRGDGAPRLRPGGEPTLGERARRARWRRLPADVAAAEFAGDSPLAPAGPEFAAYAAPSFPPDRPL